MNAAKRTEPDRRQANHPPAHAGLFPDAAPATDPTNPWHQEAAGIFVAQEQTSDRKINEPGLTDWDREQREPHR